MNNDSSDTAPAMKRAFIKKPIFDFHNNDLHYLDALTYVAIKSFDNKEGRCFPSTETIAHRSGLCASFTKKSIRRLEENKYLSVYRNPYFKAPNRSYPNYYSFPNPGKFDPIPYDLLQANDLTPYHKAMLLVLIQYATLPTIICESIKSLSDLSGLTYQIITKQLKSLANKGYVDINDIKKQRIRLSKIDWAFPDLLKVKPIQIELNHPILFIVA